MCVLDEDGVAFDGSGFCLFGFFFLVPVFLGYYDTVGTELQKM